MPDLRHALNSGRVLVMDGAMGTELQRAGIRETECYELWNLSCPAQVSAIHRSYLDAGATCVVTNTFQANPVALARFGLENQLEEICHAAVQLARAAAQADHFVLASIGPIDLRKGTAALGATLRALMDADGLLLETWSDDFEEAAVAATDARVNPRRVPVVLSLAFDALTGSEQPRLPKTGLAASEIATRVAGLDVAVLGTNCGRSIDVMRMGLILESFRGATELPLLARPNAGTPAWHAGGWHYPGSPCQFAEAAAKWAANGVQLIGGCCGTTPEHIRAAAAALRDFTG